jgi:fructokinase
LLIDFTDSGVSDQGNQLFEANPGGAPCNVLAMLAKLGRSTAFLGKVGEDMFGRTLKAAIEEVGIDSTGLVLDDHANTTLAFVRNAPDGDREFSFYRDPGADELLRPEELPESFGDVDIFHFGSLSLTREPVRSATHRAVELARQAGALVSFDPNLRASLWGSLEQAKEQMLWGCSVCDVLKVAEEELTFLTGEEDLNAGAAALRQRCPNVKLLLVTRGRDGSIAFHASGAVAQKAFLQPNTVDTTGAGDTFCGCCLNYLLDHPVDALDGTQLAEMLRFANAAAGLITTKKGAIRSMPTRAEIDRVLEEKGV